VGKGQVGTSPSPLSPWGQCPIFTGVYISYTGRPQRYCPLRGVCSLTSPCTLIVQVVLCEPTNRGSGVRITLSLFLAHTWAFPPTRPRRTFAVDTRGLTGPMPCRSSTPLSSVCPLGLPKKKETSAGHAGVPQEREPRTAPRSPPHHLALQLWPYSAAYPGSGDPGTTWDLVGQIFTPFSPGDPTTHPPCHPWIIAHSTDRGRKKPTPALQTREDPSAHGRPKRDTPRSVTAWPLQRRPYGTTLAAYPPRRRVRAVTSVRGRTRTGRIWSIDLTV
jgi:hypothetical protein